MPTIDLAEFVVVEGLPICETGIDYPASTGPFSITRSMMEAAIAYANEDPHGLAPRIKIAHGESPINSDLQSLFEQYQKERDASEPALGTIVNLSTINDGHTLIGDWYGMPGWLAEIMKSAYPARSLEGGSWQNPANNKNYDFKIDAVSLLGVVGPGCTSMSDVQELFSSAGPKVTVVEMSRPKTTMGGKNPMPAALQVNVEDIRRSFYDSFAQGDRWWWWDRELLSDPWEFIASDENGDLWRVPFTPVENENGDTEVESWGDPSPIKIKFIPDPSREASEEEETVAAAVRMVSAQINDTGTLLAVNDTPPRRKKEAKPAMAIDVPALRTRLNISEEDLPDDATEEQINAALAAEPDEETEEGSTEEPEAGTTPPTTPQASAQNDGTVRVQKEIWDRTVQGAELAITQQRERDRQDNDSFLESAIREGRITRSSKTNYLSQMNGPENDGRGPARDGLRQMIANLEKGVSMPIGEKGHGEGEILESSNEQGTGLFPKLEQQRAARAAAGKEA